MGIRECLPPKLLTMSIELTRAFQNFEVANVFTLSETGYGNEDVSSDFFTTIGTEGGQYPVPLQASPSHDMLWINGNVSLSENGSISFEPTMAGVLDWGRQSYAAAGKLLPASSKASKNSGTTADRYLSYVWLTGTDFDQSDFPKAVQGWDSTLLTARELSKGTIHNVVNNNLVNEKASWLISGQGNGSDTVELTTLHQKIVREAYSAFTNNATEVHHQAARKLSSNADLNFTPSSKFYVLKATIDFPNSARSNGSDVKAGFRILESDAESTSIYYRMYRISRKGKLVATNISIQNSRTRRSSSTAPTPAPPPIRPPASTPLCRPVSCACSTSVSPPAAPKSRRSISLSSSTTPSLRSGRTTDSS